VFQLKDETNKRTGAYMVSMRIEHTYQGLLDELLDLNVVPACVSAWKLTKK
jgi:hypothetical protein